MSDRHRTRIELATVAAQAAADKLANDILLVDVSDRLAITDVFVIVTGANERQVGAIVDAVEEKMRDAGCRPPRREGERDGRWVLLDFVDVVVHVQHPRSGCSTRSTGCGRTARRSRSSIVPWPRPTRKPSARRDARAPDPACGTARPTGTAANGCRVTATSRSRTSAACRRRRRAVGRRAAAGGDRLVRPEPGPGDRSSSRRRAGLPVAVDRRGCGRRRWASGRA